MLIDSQLFFVPPGSPLSLVGGSGVAIASPGIIDLLGAGVGVAPPGIIGSERANFGMDPGVGGNRPELMISIGTGLVAVSSATLKIALQAAPDTGAAGGYQPGTWQDVISQDNLSAANLAAGAVPFRAPWVPDMPAGLQPRFLRLLFSPQSSGGQTPGGQFSAGTIAYALVTTVRDDYAIKYAPRNYTVN